MANRHVQCRQQHLHFFQFRGCVGHEQLVGSGLRNRRSALRQKSGGGSASPAATTAACADLLKNIGCLRIVQLKALGPQRLQFLDFHGGFIVTLGARIDLILGRNPEHRARLAHAQALGIHDDLQRLVPGNILQTQGQRPGNRVRGHDVEVREVGNHLQQGPHFDVLEIQGELFTAVAGALRELAHIHLFLADLDHKLAVALVGTVLPVTDGSDTHAHGFPLLHR